MGKNSTNRTFTQLSRKSFISRISLSTEQIFDEARKQGVNVCLGACVESIDFAASKVELVAETSAGAGKSYTADLILGADGEHSICRELLLGRNDPPRSSGDIVFRLAVPAAKLAVHPSTAYHICKSDICHSKQQRQTIVAYISSD